MSLKPELSSSIGESKFSFEQKFRLNKKYIAAFTAFLVGSQGLLSVILVYSTYSLQVVSEHFCCPGQVTEYVCFPKCKMRIVLLMTFSDQQYWAA